MILLIDANILLDVLMNRQDFVKDSSMIWKLCETNQAKGYISVLTIANLMYIMRKQLDPETIEKLLVQLKFIFDFTDFGVSDLQRAAEMKWTDFTAPKIFYIPCYDKIRMKPFSRSTLDGIFKISPFHLCSPLQIRYTKICKVKDKL